MEEQTVQIVTIPIETEMDQAELLDIMIGLKSTIIEWIEQQCIEAQIDEDMISVQEASFIK
tara:strand:- start:463 stop:645 length:183 start_codon:yes stop_codon:yes gene_type:complete